MQENLHSKFARQNLVLWKDLEFGLDLTKAWLNIIEYPQVLAKFRKVTDFLPLETVGSGSPKTGEALDGSAKKGAFTKRTAADVGSSNMFDAAEAVREQPGPMPCGTARGAEVMGLQASSCHVF